jgi:hypothetical protein
VLGLGSFLVQIMVLLSLSLFCVEPNSTSSVESSTFSVLEDCLVECLKKVVFSLNPN